MVCQKLGITPAHLSTIVKQTTDKTCVEIITSMVIMDAKAQLKSTDLSIHDIAYSLEFHEYVFLRQIFQAACGMGRWNTGTAKTKFRAAGSFQLHPPCTTRLATSLNR